MNLKQTEPPKELMKGHRRCTGHLAAKYINKLCYLSYVDEEVRWVNTC